VTLPNHVRVLVRGWLHGNVVALPGDRPTLVDSGYHTGADETLAFARSQLGPRLHQVVLTHVHSDHAGGVAEIVAQAGGSLAVAAHADARDLVDRWDERGLWLGVTGQHLPRFEITETLGDQVVAGDRPWRVIQVPGHATGGVALFDPRDGVLISGDALWEDGFGAVNPWLDGEERFALAALALDRIEAVAPRWVVPGHGEPFTDVVAALQRARSRLAYMDERRDRLQALTVLGLLSFLRMGDRTLGRRELHSRALTIARAFPVDGQDPGAVAEAAIARLVP